MVQGTQGAKPPARLSPLTRGELWLTDTGRGRREENKATGLPALEVHLVLYFISPDPLQKPAMTRTGRAGLGEALSPEVLHPDFSIWQAVLLLSAPYSPILAETLWLQPKDHLS